MGSLECTSDFCLNELVNTCTCSVSGNILAWFIRYPNKTSAAERSHDVTQSNNILNNPYKFTGNRGSEFTSTLSKLSPPTATLSFTAVSSLQNYDIVCLNGSTPNIVDILINYGK